MTLSDHSVNLVCTLSSADLLAWLTLAHPDLSGFTIDELDVERHTDGPRLSLYLSKPLPPIQP